MSSDLEVVAERSLSKDNPVIVKEINAKVNEIEAFRKELVKRKNESNIDVSTVLKLWSENPLRKFIEDKIENTTDNEAEIGFDKRQETEAASKAKLKSTMVILVLGIILSIVISFITAGVITSPILELAKACIAFAKGDYGKRSNIVGSPEINFLSEAFNEMAGEVEKRDRLIKIEHEKISDLLNNMSQAIFSILPDGTIAGPVSKYSETLFGEVIEGKNINQVLYRDLPSSSEDLAKVKTALAVVFGEDELQWSFMEDSFIPRVIRNNGKEQILKVKVTPLWNSKKLLAKIMFVVEDVTEVEALARKIELARQKNERDIQIIQSFYRMNRKISISVLKSRRDAF
ncbi:MAG: HAMP domain-containing protein [Bacteriovoracaceae bacterium]